MLGSVLLLGTHTGDAFGGLPGRRNLAFMRYFGGIGIPFPRICTKTEAVTTAARIVAGLNRMGAASGGSPEDCFRTSRGTRSSPAIAPKPLLNPESQMSWGPIGF